MKLGSFLRWLLLVVGANILASTAMPTQTQVHLGVSDQSQETERPSFGVGFDLTASYGTAAISFPNGTITTVAKIPAEDGYDEVLQRLSLYSSCHLSPPYQHLFDWWYDEPRQTIRKVRKAIGLPASKDVGYLANMIIALRSAVEKHLQTSISSAGITTLHMAALYPEDMLDACEYAKLEYLSFPFHIRDNMLYETSTAYAGYGYGLCDNYREREGCKKEQDDMDFDAVMAVLFTRSVLTVTLSGMHSAYYLWEPDYRHYSNFSLGYDSKTRQQNEQGYWNAVTNQLEEIMVKFPYYERPRKVLLMGDCVDDKNFRAALEKVLSRQMDTLPEILSHDAEFTAAKGTAELTKRLPWDPY